MDFMKIGKARNLLIESEKAKKALIDALRQNTITENMKNKLLLVNEIISFCERDEMDIDLVEVFISSLLEGGKPTTDDFMNILEMLSECQSNLEDYISESIHPSIRRSEEFNDYCSAITEYIRGKQENTKEKRKELVRRQIYDIPGLFAKYLTEILQEIHGKEGFSYSNVLLYLKQLSSEKKIITIGGPQGRVKYCFPDPSTIEDRTRFYDKFFACQGIVEEKVTNKFTQMGGSKFRDIFLVNHVNRPILLSVSFGKVRNIEKSFIKSYGDLKRYEYLVIDEGFIPEDQTLNLDILEARKITQIEDGKEEELWIDKDRALLFPITH